MNTLKLYMRLIAGVVIISLSACKKDKIDWYAPVGPPLNSNVKFLNAIPKSSLDFYTYFTRVSSGVKFGDSVVPYTKTAFGNIIVYVTNLNQTSYRITAPTGATNPQVNAQGLVADFYQTMFACKANDSAAAETAILLRDNLTPPATGKAHIRFVHLAQRGTTKMKKFDFMVSSGPMGAMPIFQNLSYQVPSNSVRIIPSNTAKPNETGLNTPGLGPYTSGPFTPIDAGTYVFDVTETGTTNIVAKSQSINLVAGQIYTFFTLGIIGGDPAPAIKYVTHTPNP